MRPGRLVGIAVAGALSCLGVRGIDAHKGITSRYTYNDDVFPILRDKCGSCHVDGGAAPMSLMTYGAQSGAVAWAESIRENLVAEAMPPWYVDPAGPAVRGGHTLSPHELDVVLTWATGGTPQGNLRKTPSPMKAEATWTLGMPDLVLALPREVKLGPGQMDASADFAVPTTLTAPTWVKAIDLLPGTPSIVRSAAISLESGPPLTLWEPGGDRVAAPEGTGFKLPAGARLLVHIRYKKSYLDEQKIVADRSAIGLYLAASPSPVRDIQSLLVSANASDGGSAPRTFTKAFESGGRVVALRPSVDQPYEAMTVDAVVSGGRVPLLKLRGIRPEWPRRYWLANPIDVPPGATIEVSGVPSDPDTGPLASRVDSPLDVGVDFISQ